MTGAALSLDPAFWQAEAKCLLLSRNNAFLTSENAKHRCAEFTQLLTLVKEPERYVNAAKAEAKPTNSAEYDRIFREDAVRTFASETYRDAEVNTLYKVFDYVKDYHQGLGFIVAFLRIFMTEEEVVTLCCYLNDSVCEGYFKLENEEYLKDAYVFDALTENCSASFSFKAPDTQYLDPLQQTCNRLKTSCFSGQFLSKWFIGICIHVFPFEGIYELLKLILTKPSKTTWFRFAASLITAASDDLAKASGTSEMIKVLKFDSQIYPNDLTIGQLRPSLFKTKLLEDEDATSVAVAADEADAEAAEGGGMNAEESAYVCIVRRAYDIEIDSEVLGLAEAKVRKMLDEQKRAREAAALRSDDSDSFNFSDEEN